MRAANLDSKASGHGYSFGFYFRPDPKVDVSIAYRSPVDMKAKDGTATFKFPSTSIYPLLGLNSSGTDGFTATLPLVEEYTVGLTYKVTPKWLISADFNYHGWSRYTQLTLDFASALWLQEMQIQQLWLLLKISGMQNIPFGNSVCIQQYDLRTSWCLL